MRIWRIFTLWWPVSCVSWSSFLPNATRTKGCRRRIPLLRVAGVTAGIRCQLGLPQPSCWVIPGVRWISGRSEDVPGQRKTVLSYSITKERLGIRMRRTIRPLHSPPPSEVTIFEHVFALGIQSPIVTLPFTSTFPWYLYEALVQTQVVSYRILPAFLVAFKVGEV